MIRNMASDVGKTLVGAFAVGSVVQGIRGLANEAERLTDKAAKFGVLPSEIEKLENVARVSGASVAGLNQVLNSAWRRAQEATDGNERYARSFERLGISVDDLKGQNPVEIFMSMADGVKNSTDRMEAFAAVFDVAGEQGREFFQMLERGSEDIERTGEEMGAMGDRTVRAFSTISVSFRKTWSVLKNVSANILAGLLSVGQTVFSVVAGIVFSIADLFRGNIEVFKAMIGMIADIGKAFLRLGNVIKKALKFDFSGAAREFKAAGSDLGNAVKEGYEEATDGIGNMTTRIKANVGGAIENIKDLWSSQTKPPADAQPNLPKLTPEFDAGQSETDRDRERMAKLRLTIAEREWEVRLKQMSAEERLAELERVRAGIARLANDETEEGLRMKMRLLDIEERIREEKEQAARDKEKPEPDKPESDSPELLVAKATGDFLQRVGGGGRTFTGPEGQAVDVAKKQLAVQERIARAVEKPTETPDLSMRA